MKRALRNEQALLSGLALPRMLATVHGLERRPAALTAAPVNLQLRLAASCAEDAETRWRAHKRDCPKCTDAQRRRQGAKMCPGGQRLYADRQATAADLAEERRLAKLPIPGQEALFE